MNLALKDKLHFTRSTIDFFESVLMLSKDGILVTDFNQNILLANEAFCRFLGEDKNNLLETSLFIWLEKFAGDPISDWLEVEETLALNAGYIGAAFSLHETKSNAHYSVNCSLVKQSPGLPDIIISNWRDVTDETNTRIQNEALITELENANRELEEFAHVASHDLKSPLITISGFLDKISYDLAEKNFENFTRDITTMQNASEHMFELINSLLHLARAGLAIEVPVKTPLLILINKLLPTLKWETDSKHIVVDVADNLPTVMADPVRLSEAIQNLLSNAIKYFGDQPNPKIEIGVRAESDDKVFYVRDNGSGIDPKDHETIFTPFNQLDPDTEGNGLGLALVQRIINAHGCKIWVESEGLRKGSTFCFTLPK